MYVPQLVFTKHRGIGLPDNDRHRALAFETPLLQHTACTAMILENAFHDAFRAAVALGGPTSAAHGGGASAASSRWLNAHLAW